MERKWNLRDHVIVMLLDLFWKKGGQKATYGHILALNAIKGKSTFFFSWYRVTVNPPKQKNIIFPQIKNSSPICFHLVLHILVHDFFCLRLLLQLKHQHEYFKSNLQEIKYLNKCWSGGIFYHLNFNYISPNKYYELIWLN